MEYSHRKRIRLPDFDYSTPGAYFVTVCTAEKRCILSRIAVGEGLAPPAVSLTAIGRIVETQILAVSKRYPSITVEKYIIMPNHVHLLLCLTGDSGGASPSPTVFDALRVLKSMNTRLSRTALGKSALWQRSYHEHVIRNEKDYLDIWTYIDQNPAKWAEDRYYTAE